MTNKLDQHAFLHQRAREFRKESTEAEHFLWHHLKARKLAGLKFRRQHPIGPFVADFYCHELRLVVEVDGEIHFDQKEYDRQRDLWFSEQGIKTIRFTNREVLNNLSGVLEILAKMKFSCEANGEIDSLPD